MTDDALKVMRDLCSTIRWATIQIRKLLTAVLRDLGSHCKWWCVKIMDEDILTQREDEVFWAGALVGEWVPLWASPAKKILAAGEKIRPQAGPHPL
jgi:hypothetical protein